MNLGVYWDSLWTLNLGSHNFMVTYGSRLLCEVALRTRFDILVLKLQYISFSVYFSQKRLQVFDI